MGKYKVFNGSNWVDICDCNVHIRNATDNWQLLDPTNCVTKYWTGTEWCEIVCCSCAEGYTLNPLTNICETVERIPATASGGTFYPIIVGNKAPVYGNLGGALYPNITGATFPINGYSSPAYIVKDAAGTGLTYSPTLSVAGNQIFNSNGTSTGGRLNYNSLWGDSYPPNTWFTLRFCITITQNNTYIFALAGDNQVKASITSTTFQGGVTSFNLVNLWASTSSSGTPADPSNTGPFNYWHMFPIDLPVGDHVFELSGYNFFDLYGFAAEVYDIPVLDLQNLMASSTATVGDLEPYIMFKTKDLIRDPPLFLPQAGSTGIVYSCPSGYTFTECYGAPQCTIDITYPCGGTPPEPSGCNCIDGNIGIGTQLWTCKNLDVTTYRNGDPIPEVTDPTAWAALTTGAWCYYDNDPANNAIYGKLYNWYAVNDPRGLAPTGYHVPSDTEWTTLTDYLGGSTVAGGELKEVGTTHWADPNNGATNSACFTALGGDLRFDSGNFIGDPTNETGNWWSSTEFNTDLAWQRFMFSYSGQINRTTYRKQAGFSVRLIKD